MRFREITYVHFKTELFLAFAYTSGLIPIAVGIFSRAGIFGWPPMLAGLAIAEFCNGSWQLDIAEI